MREVREDIVLREDKRDLRFMSEVLLITGRTLTQIGGGSFLLLILLMLARFTAEEVPIGPLIFMIPFGIFGGVILLVIGGLLRPGKERNATYDNRK
jgi:hypothetical protein